MAAVVPFTQALLTSTTGQLIPAGTAVTVTNMDNSNPVSTSPAGMFTDSSGSVVAGSNVVNTDSSGNLTVYVIPDGTDGTGQYKFTPAGFGVQIFCVFPQKVVGRVLNESVYAEPPTGVGATDKANLAAGLALALTATATARYKLQPGQYNALDWALALPPYGSGPNLRISGAGRPGFAGGTKLWFSTDRGAGTFAIMGAGTENDLYFHEIDHLEMLGPGTRPTNMGDPMVGCAMSGLWLGSRMKIHHGNTQGFVNGIQMMCNHSEMRSWDVNNNFDGIRWAQNRITNGGDVLIDNCDLSGNVRASHSVAAPTFACFTMVKGHLGFSPYCMYFDSGASGGVSLLGTQFNGTSWEAVGNSYLYSPDQSAIATVVQFLQCGNFTRNATYQITAVTLNPGIRMAQFTEAEFLNGFPLGISDGPLFDINSYFRMTSDQWTLSFANQGGSYPWMKGGTVNPPKVRLTDTNNDACAFVTTVAAAVVVGNVLQWHVPTNSYYQVEPWGQAGAYGRYAGVAMNASASTGSLVMVVVATRSDGAFVLVDSAAASSYHVVPSSVTVGKATGIVYGGSDTSTGGRPIIGESQIGVVPNAVGTVVIHVIDGPGGS